MRMKRAGIITKIVVFALVVYAAVTLIDMRAKIDAARAAQESVRQEVESGEITNAELQYELEHQDDDDVKEKIARENLNLVAPGERVFYNSAD